MVQMAKLREENKLAQQKIGHLEERVKHLEEANIDLKRDKDFLVAQLNGAQKEPKSSENPGTMVVQTL